MSGCCSRVANGISKVCDGVSEVWEHVSTPGEAQKAALAFMRADVGIAAVAFHPFVAASGALASALAPNAMATVVDFADGMVSGLWNRMSFRQRCAAMAVGIPLAYFGFSVMWVPASILSAKVGAEYAIRNHKKEEIAALVAKLEGKIN